ncbi:MAG TPA: dienelactone hydrolase family protein [Nitrososphaeraceae archaeon]|jgi:carboxymethylenebutenolidase
MTGSFPIFSTFCFVIFASMLLSTTIGNFNTIPSASAQTNAAAISALYSNSTNASNAQGLVIKKMINYFDNSSGYLVYPNSISSTSKKVPGVIMIHENRGLNSYIKDMANTLAKQGYAVLAVDLFNGQTATNNDQARLLSTAVRNNQSEATNNLRSAVKYLSSLPFVDPTKIASIGWCFGGGQSLQLALNSQNHPLVATILYYGTPLITDSQQLSKIKWPLLGIFGDKDQANPLPLINKFKAVLDSDKISNEILIYKGLGHAFANPSNQNYAPKETADAWQKTIAFLKRNVSQ